MPADKDQVTTTKPAPHNAAASRGRMPADKDEATRNKPGAVGEDKEEPLAAASWGAGLVVITSSSPAGIRPLSAASWGTGLFIVASWEGSSSLHDILFCGF